jgi:hypothetical protein
LNLRQGGPHSRSGHFGEEKILLPLRGIEPPIFQSIVPSTFRLRYLGFFTTTNKTIATITRKQQTRIIRQKQKQNSKTKKTINDNNNKQ